MLVPLMDHCLTLDSRIRATEKSLLGFASEGRLKFSCASWFTKRHEKHLSRIATKPDIENGDNANYWDAGTCTPFIFRQLKPCNG